MGELKNFKQKLKLVKLAIFDVDGVFTDGTIYLNNQGEELRQFHLHDGLGIKLLHRAGIEVAIITAKTSEMVKIRMQSLGIKYIYQGYENKVPAFQEICKILNMDASQVIYTGDDLPDLPLIQMAGLGIAVANATEMVRENADYVLQKKGGKGAVREICEILLKANDKYQGLLHDYEQITSL